jgi:hypothetical protein
MSFDDYAKWFVNVIQCKSCIDYRYCEKNNKGCVCNSIIDGCNQPGEIYPIRPQAGYINSEWFNEPRNKNEIRILLLGMNPGKGYKADNSLYEIYEEILNQSNIPQMTKEHINKIGEQVLDYKVFDAAIAIIKNNMMSKNKLIFACSNQVLCRSNPEAGKITKKAGIEKVYKKCFETHTSELINIVSPDLIIAMGTSWGNYFDDNISSVFDKNKYLIVHHPSRPNNRKIAEKKIKVFFCGV